MSLDMVRSPPQEHKFILPVLEPFSPCFTLPRLDDKPQDPVVQTIPSSPQVMPLSQNHTAGQPMSSAVSSYNEASFGVPAWASVRTLWNEASAFSSQQIPLASLHLAVLGISSQLFAWNVDSQSFIRAGSLGASEFNGMSPSILQRFLDLGALVRRLGQLIQELRGRQGRINTTMHAFAHSLSSVLMSVRNRLSLGPLSRAPGDLGIHPLASMWVYYDQLEKIVISLAAMCSMSMDTIPDKFSLIPASAVDLLSLVYETFEMHVERHSPRSITAIVAYILTVSSKPYIRALCKLLAYGEIRQVFSTATEKTFLVDLTFEGDEADSPWRSEGGGIDAEGPFPKFIPEKLTSILPVAHKSLKLLEAARPDHPAFSADKPSKEISWLWDERSIKSLWNEAEVNGSPVALEMSSFRSLLNGSQMEQFSGDQDLLAEFRVFDLEPGLISSSEDDSPQILDKFIDSFPVILPSITPSPTLLCDLMFSPLQDHAASISRALLAVFLDRSSSLCIDAHLGLLRSHMLLTSHSFKSRLSIALFSDAEDRETRCEQLYNLLRCKSKSAALPDQSHLGRWPVGLAPLLVARDSWPPGGSELSFLLRAVIVDSQQNNAPSAESTSESDGARRVMGEAELHLGFAIRELSGRGHDRWLDPLSIEALDFLYLDYKVPQPLQSMIPTAVLSKYQRIFALLLRMTRVECAIRSVFRLTRTTALPLFPILSSARRLLLHFRFVAHSYLTTLSTYLYDTAIGGNFDAFLLRITACRETLDTPNSFRDAFALAECHSSVLDDILSACLLRSTQRAASELLRGTLEVVLEFCVLAGDLRDSRIEEYQASHTLEVLYTSFCKKVSALVRALEVMLERHGKPLVSGQLHPVYSEWESRSPPGGVDALRHLLTCLNQNNWWTRP